MSEYKNYKAKKSFLWQENITIKFYTFQNVGKKNYNVKKQWKSNI
jgi:hypothetical protein